VVTAGRGAGEAAVRATGAPLTRAPLTLLVNEWSASASEIFAGALHDNCRAVLVGNRCAGGGRSEHTPQRERCARRARLLSRGTRCELASEPGSVAASGGCRGQSTQTVRQGFLARCITPSGAPRADPAAPRARTYGKGLIQSVYELSDSSGLVLTVGKYLTPARTDIDREGIAPDFRHTPSAPAAAARLAACRAPGRA